MQQAREAHQLVPRLVVSSILLAMPCAQVRADAIRLQSADCVASLRGGILQRIACALVVLRFASSEFAVLISDRVTRASGRSSLSIIASRSDGLLVGSVCRGRSRSPCDKRDCPARRRAARAALAISSKASGAALSSRSRELEGVPLPQPARSVVHPSSFRLQPRAQRSEAPRT